MIVKIEPNPSGSHANQFTTPCAIPDGWIELPPNLEVAFIASGSFCDLIFEDDVLVGITPLPIPEPDPIPPASMTTEEAMMDMLIDLSYRMDLQELGLL